MINNILELCDNLLIDDEYDKRKSVDELEKIKNYLYTEKESYNWYAIPYLFHKINELEILLIEDRYDKKQIFEIRKFILDMFFG